MSVIASSLICRTTDSTGSNLSLNLNDGTTYLTEFYYLGDPVRDETWIHPDGGYSYLARVQDRPTTLTIALHVLSHSLTNVSQLQAKLIAVRNQFDQAVNYLELGLGGTQHTTLSATRSGTTVTLTTEQPHGISVGERIFVKRLGTDEWNNDYSGNTAAVRNFGWTTIAGTTGNTVVYTIPAAVGATPTVKGIVSAEGTFQRYRTYPSVIAPAAGQDARSLARAIAQHLVIDWAFEVWRDPYAVGAGPQGDLTGSTTRHPVI